ncbi:MAG: monovalent cation/H+ antiporter subunit A [Rubrivivax sp.]|nr:monovalent cation/H+ antiporter subunit A [Rubrivivax sp.]
MQLLALAILLPLLLGGPLCAAIGARLTPARRYGAAWAAAGVTAVVMALLLSQAPAVFAGQTLLQHTAWMPAIGLHANFRLDGLALMFGLMITGVGLLVILYAAYYLGPEERAGRFYGQLMLFMAAMLGIVLSDNLLLLVVFWELTSISSFLLVGFWGHRAEARAGARMALAVTGAGGLALLGGVVLLGQIAGTYDLSAMLGRGAQIQADARFTPALLLILLGCFTKSAQLPFHFWLPEAMAAPTPVSAYLHSATMVKAGIFLLMRLYPVISGGALFELVVAGVGLATMVFGAYVAMFKHDLKGLLAYSTISHLGLIVFLIGLDSPLSAVAAVFHILNHATFKAALFMTAGIIDHETGTRDMRKLAGLMKAMPWTATLAMIAAAAMAGVPLANGFLSKEMMFGEALHARVGLLGSGAVAVLVTLAAIFGVAYSLRFIHDVFFNGEPKDLPKPQPHEPPLFMKAPVALLVLVCVVVGVLPSVTVGPLVQVAATAMLGAPPPDYHLALWHGINVPLLMSGLAMVGGVALYFVLQRGYDLHLHHPRGWTGRLVFTKGLDGLFGLARRCTARLENGSLQRYAAWMVASAVAVAAWPLMAGLAAGDGIGTGGRVLLPATPLALVLWALLAATCMALVLTHHQRLQAVILVGVVGLVTAVAFLGFSAPDLALTQLTVEVVSTVLLLMGLALLPAVTPRESSTTRRGRDALLALAAGGGMAWLAWLVLTRDHDAISWFFLDKAVPEGGGANVVNVILVDFRGYDTWGEITVLAVAGLGVLALLDGLRVRRPATDAAGRGYSYAQPPLMLRTAARLLLPMSLVAAVYFFWRGHGLPGGGFVAGLVTAVALVMQYMALGQQHADALLASAGGRRYTLFIALGLAIATFTGLGSFAFDHPFLSSASGHPVVALLGELPLATAALFDLGVYLTVVASTMLTLSALGAASETAAERADLAAKGGAA